MISNKKAQFLELMFAVVFLLVFLLVAVFVFRASDELNDSFQLDTELSQESKDTYDDLNTSYPSMFDGIGLMVFIGLWIFALILAYNSQSNPIMLVMGLFIVVMIGVVSMIASNVWGEVSSDDEMSSFSASFPKMGSLFDNYLLVAVLMGGSVLIVGLSRGGGF